MQQQDLIWILDGYPSSVTFYQQTLGLQHQLRVFGSLGEFVVVLENLANDKNRKTKPLLIVDPDTVKGAFRDLLLRSSSGRAKGYFPDCLIVSRLDDLNLLRLYLKAGALDYLFKPIRPNELVSKVEKALQSIHQLEVQILRNDLDGQEVKDLTFREHQILTLLLSRPERAVKRDELCDALWNKVTVNRKTLDVHLFNLRRKLRPHGYDIFCRSQLFTLGKQIESRSNGEL